MAIIQFHKVGKVFHNGSIAVAALTDINLEVEEGEFVCIAGPSGSGKSTLLHLAGILDQPSAGDVLINGRVTGRFDKKAAALFRREHIGFIFQRFNLIPVLTAFENVEYILSLQDVPAHQRKKEVTKTLEAVGLAEFLHQKTGNLSGGQQQRVAVARAIVARPRIILADEPTGSLDSETGSALIELFKEINGQQRTTFIFSSHDPLIISQASRIVNLRDGGIVRG